MFFFPTRTDRRLKRTPWVNYTLIAINLLIFLFTERMVKANANELRQFYLDPMNYGPVYLMGYKISGLMKFVSYQFLHVDVWHVMFNMLFLYVFGNGVEDRLGRIGYLFFYLTGGVVAGIGHCLFSASPVLGASGSVAAVTGAYLALFPMSNVTIVYWFIFFGAFEVSSMLLILFRVAQDFLFQFLNIGNTAYMAHLSGYALGFAVGMGLLFTRLLSREPYDMLSMIEHRRRRAQFQKLTRSGYQPWEAGGSGGGRHDKPASPEAERIMNVRAQIAEAIDRLDLPAAADHYTQLLGIDAAQVLSQQHQLDIANQLMSSGRYDTAATAYELFLKTYPRYTERAHVQLILGLIYGRYLDQPARARELLTTAQPNLSQDEQQLAREVLAELPAQS